ncbi:MAG: alpha/beta hydrolase [Candidatus Dormibacteraceae bacterium]
MTFGTLALLVLLGLVLCWLLGCVVLYRRLFVPNQPTVIDDEQFTPIEFQADHEDVELRTADGVEFAAWFFRQPGTPQVVVVSPGHKSRRQDTLAISIALWRKGFNVLALSLRGMAGSDRVPVTLGVREVQEVAAALAFVRRRIHEPRIGLLGYSMGASISLLAAAGDPEVLALVLDSPFRDARQVVSENIWSQAHLPGWLFLPAVAAFARLRRGFRLADANLPSAMSGLERRPLFFIHGADDRVTSVKHSRALYDAYKGPREIWVVQGAGHCGSYYDDRTLYVERVSGFFSRTLGLKANQLRLLDESEEAG